MPVVRSRFYGKGKDKAKDNSANGHGSGQRSALGSTFGPQFGGSIHGPALGSRSNSTSAQASGQPPWPQSQPTLPLVAAMSIASRPSFDRHGPLPAPTRELRHPRSTNSVRPSTDAVTMTLAQRLNELAIANDQGLLDDDEYRLLRQNLFERFTSNSAVPTEAPIVRMSNVGSSSSAPTPSSSRPESVRSKVSLTSLSGLFKRSRWSRDSSDTASIISASSTFPRRSISKQTSQLSLQNDTRPQPDRNSKKTERATLIIYCSGHTRNDA